MMKNLVEIDDIVFGYNGKPVLKSVSARIHGGNVLAVIGPNGSGKTTFIRILLGLARPHGGRIRLEGRNINFLARKELARKMAYVPQSHREAFGYSVADVVLMGRMPHVPFFGRYGKNDHVIVTESLAKMSIGHLHDRPYTEISGGERQLVLIARAVAQEAKIIVMDEPSSSLDFGNQLRLLDTVRRLSGYGYTFIFTTHHPEHAMSVADRVIMMSKGTIINDGKPEDIITPENMRILYDLDKNLMPSENIFLTGSRRIQDDRKYN